MFDLAPRAGGFPQRPDRRTERTLTQIDRVTDVAEAKVAGIHRVAQRAQMWSLMTTLVKRRAELMAPDAAETQNMIALAADMACVFIISDLPRQMK